MAPTATPTIVTQGRSSPRAASPQGPRAADGARLHAVTWLVWAVAATVSVQLAPNPLLVVLVVAVAWLVVETHRRPGPLGRAFPVLVGLGVVFGLVRVAISALTTQASGAALATLPAVTMPRLLGGFAIGGPIEGAVIVATAADGLVVIGVMAAFGAFNAVAAHHELLAAAPRAFHEPGLVVAVALAFVPSTLEAAAAARDADRARTGGRVHRRGRSVRLAVPVLESGLERAIHLAESMDSRGFGRARATGADRILAALVLGALGSLSGALVALVGRAAGVAAALAGLGLVGVVAATVLSGRTSPTRYRRRSLGRGDRLVLAAVVAVPVGLGVCSLVGVDGLTWEASALPRPPLRLPLVPAALVLALAVPALVRPDRP